MATSQKSLSSQALWFFAGRVASLFVSFFVPVVLVRIFSKENYGTYAQIVLIYGLSFGVLQFGFRNALHYFLPKYNNAKAYYVTNTFIFLAVLGVLNLALLTIFRTNIALFFNAKEMATLLPLCGLYILFMLASSPFEITLIIESQAEKAALVSFASELLRGVLIISFVLIFETLLAALMALVFYSFLRSFFYALFAYKYFGIRLDKKNVQHYKQQFKYAAPMGFAGLFWMFSEKLDKLVISAFFTPQVYALYAVGNFKEPLTGTLFTSVVNVILPRAVEFLKDNKISQFLELWKQVIIRLSFVGIGAFFGLQLLGHDLITLLFTNKYEASVPIFRIMTLLILGQMFAYGVILRALGYTKDILKSYILAFIIAMPTIFLLAKYFGPIGAAASAVAVFFVNVMSHVFFSTKRLKRKFTDIFPVMTMFKMGIIGCISFLVLFNAQKFIEYKLLRMCISGMVFLGAYTFSCYRMNIYNPFKEELFRKVVHWYRLARI